MTCPLPLLEANANNTNAFEIGGLTCSFRCEGTMVNQDDLDNYNTLVVAVSGTSLVLATFLFLTWGLFSVKVRQKMTFWVAFTSVGVTSCVFFPSVFKNGATNVWCKDELEGFRQTDGISACVIQGMAVLFFGLALCCWWWCSCFDLFSKLYLRKRDIGHYIKYYHIFSWSVPSFCTGAILVSGNFGYEQPRLWCFFSPEAPDAFEYIFFYAWVGALWVTGTIMMLLVIWSIISHARGYQGKAGTKFYKKFALYRTPLIFVLLFSVFWAVFFTFIVVVNGDEELYVEDAEEWISCLFIELTLSAGDPDAPALECGDKQPNGISPGLLTTAVLTLTGNGILLFFIFGLQSENFVLWYRWLSSGCAADSVRPKNSTSKSLSQFKELRRGAAVCTISLCQNFAGMDKSNVLEAKGKTGKYDEPDLQVEGKAYEGFGGPPEAYAPVSPMMGSPLPEHSYHSERGDPFPRRPVISQSTIPAAGTPPPGLEQFYNQNPQQAEHQSGGWSDIYDDPLWGVNVEF